MPVRMSFPIPWLLAIWPMNESFPLFMLFMRVALPIFCRTHSLLFLSLQLILKILLYHHISNEFSLFSSVFLITQHSQPYVATVKTEVFRILIFVFSPMERSFYILFKLITAFLAIVNRLLISLLSLESFLIFSLR